MGPTRRAVLAATAASLPLAGCVGGDGGSTPTGTQTSGSTDTPTDGGDGGSDGGGGGTGTVRVTSHADLGRILVGPEGMTLYMFDADARGEMASSCHDSCAQTWPPLTVDGSPTAGGDVTAELTTFEREGGARQVAANGWPLYYFAPDGEPGDVEGQGVNDVWWVLAPDGTPRRSDSSTATPTPTTSGGDGGGYGGGGAYGRY